jgi:hypothetical protein
MHFFMTYFGFFNKWLFSETSITLSPQLHHLLMHFWQQGLDCNYQSAMQTDVSGSGIPGCVLSLKLGVHNFLLPGILFIELTPLGCLFALLLIFCY